MKVRAARLLMFMAVASPCLADELTRRVVTSTLDCHGAQISAVSTYDPHFSAHDSFVWFDQVLTLKSKVDRAPERLSFDPAPTLPFEGSQRLQRAVYSWACVHGTTADYLVVMLGCTRDDLGDDRGGICHGQREWLRIIDLQGRHLDTGLLPQDPRTPALLRELGIAEPVKLRGLLDR